MIQQEINHDWTKLDYFDEFWDDYNAQLTDDDFKNGKWYPIHIKEEKHHPNSYLHEDITLLDVLEMIVDCVMAGKGRFGFVNYDFLKLDKDILDKAYWNTVKLLDDSVEVSDEYEC